MTELLAEKDLRTLMTFLEEARRAEPTAAMPWAVVDGLLDLVGCDHVGFTEFDIPRKVFLTEQFNEGGGVRTLDFDLDDPDLPYWKLWYDFLSCSYAIRTGDLNRVVMISDFYTLPALRSTPFYCELNQGNHLHRMVVSLPAPPGQARRILLDRETGSGFTERDRLLMQLLRPHLYEIYLDGQRRRNGVPRLTQRELQVLQLAAQGCSNATIARQLFVSIATVRKHMEHIFDRTGVRSRAAAAALVLPHLSVTDPH
jgi:DNA-binding CsgD family transcriptional regulator